MTNANAIWIKLPSEEEMRGIKAGSQLHRRLGAVVAVCVCDESRLMLMVGFGNTITGHLNTQLPCIPCHSCEISHYFGGRLLLLHHCFCTAACVQRKQ